MMIVPRTYSLASGAAWSCGAGHARVGGFWDTAEQEARMAAEKAAKEEAERKNIAAERVALLQTEYCVSHGNAEVSAIDAMFVADAKKKYGPHGFAASVTTAQLGVFREDKKFYAAWRSWRSRWETFAKRATLTLAEGVFVDAVGSIGDTFRRQQAQCERYEEDMKDWRRAARTGSRTPPKVRESYGMERDSAVPLVAPPVVRARVPAAEPPVTTVTPPFAAIPVVLGALGGGAVALVIGVAPLLGAVVGGVVGAVLRR